MMCKQRKLCKTHLCYLNEDGECELCLDTLYKEQPFFKLPYDDLTEDQDEYDY